MLCLGARLAATGRQEGDWIECARAGWVHQRHLAPLEVFEPDPATVAARYLHTPYLWGGRESLGLDCSGLIQQAHEAAGILLPRDSDMQLAWAGAPIADWQRPGALARGDLVFWEGHAGIMLDAAQIVHANAWHMAVAIEPLGEAIARIRSLYADPVGAVRIDPAQRGRTPAWMQPGWIDRPAPL
jgi:cell wall-associated NlpC family hydrolase